MEITVFSYELNMNNKENNIISDYEPLLSFELRINIGNHAQYSIQNRYTHGYPQANQDTIQITAHAW